MRSSGYIVSRFSEGSLVRLHRFIMEAEQGEIVDHTNHDVTDNRHCNLRVVDNIHSMMNIGISKRNKSGIKGVFFKDGKWTASITVNMKEKYLGSFDDIEEAADARRAAEIKYFGEHNYDESVAAVPRIEGIPWAEPLERYRTGVPDEGIVDVTVENNVMPAMIDVGPLSTLPAIATQERQAAEQSAEAQINHAHFTGHSTRPSSTTI